MNFVPSFETSPQDHEIAAQKWMITIPIFPLIIEKKVVQTVLLIFSSITRFFITIPYFLLQPATTPESKHLKAVFIGTVAALILINIGDIILPYHLSFEAGLSFANQQPFYKSWGIWAILFVGSKTLSKIRRNSHLIIRGAIREGSSLIFPIILHVLSVLIQFYIISLYNGCLLMHFGGPKNLFISSLFHLEFILFKKLTPKPTEGSPLLTESFYRITAFLAFLYNTKHHSLHSGLPILFFDFGFSFLRSFIIGMSDSGKKLQEVTKKSYIVYSNPTAGFDDNLFICVSNEAYAIILVDFILRGSLIMRISALAIIGVFGGFSFFNKKKRGAFPKNAESSISNPSASIPGAVSVPNVRRPSPNPASTKKHPPAPKQQSSSKNPPTGKQSVSVAKSTLIPKIPINVSEGKKND